MAALATFSRTVQQLTCFVRPYGYSSRIQIMVGCPLSSVNTHSLRCNSNKAATTRVKRPQYVRMYPTVLVQPDGSSVRIRHKDPRLIIKLPVDLTKLTSAEIAYRKQKLSPVKKIEIKEEVEDSFDINTYANMLKK